VTRVVVDASVAVKWVLAESGREPLADEALGLLDAIASGRLSAHQPPHWLAEVAAVLARLAPEVAARSVAILHSMEIPVVDAVEVYERACALSVRLRHHLFDTLYHAVAQTLPDTVLVTADDHYHRKAKALGAIRHLRQMR
jgi:predicted nucleic acid-binding protein